MLTCLDDLSAGPAAVREPNDAAVGEDGLAGPDDMQTERQEAAAKGHVVIIGALPLLVLMLAVRIASATPVQVHCVSCRALWELQTALASLSGRCYEPPRCPGFRAAEGGSIRPRDCDGHPQRGRPRQHPQGARFSSIMQSKDCHLGSPLCALVCSLSKHLPKRRAAITCQQMLAS